MTKQRNDSHSTEFGLWLRQLPAPLTSVNISCQNLDYIWHNYQQSWLITIEEKRYDGVSSYAQIDTHNIIRQMLEKASGCMVSTARNDRRIEYRGHYIIRFSSTNPDDGEIEINGVKVTKEELIHLLTFGTCYSTHGIIKDIIEKG